MKETPNMKKLNLSLAILALAAMSVNAQTTVNSDIVGYVKRTLAAGSDTIIAPQLQRPVEYTGAVGSVVTSGDNATLSCTGATFIANGFQYVANTQPKTYFALVTAGTLTGTTFRVVSNGTGDLVVARDGLTVVSADITAIELRPYWTLNTLFPSADSSVSFTPSTGVNSLSRRTQLVLPNFVGLGINRAPATLYFYNPTLADWVSTTVTGAKAGDTIIEPGQYIVHRNTGGTPVELNATAVGGLLTKSDSIYLATLSSASNDNPMALPRASDYLLSAIGFTDANFLQSTGKNSLTRKDQVLVYDTTGTGINRAPSKIYFKYLGAWYDTSSTGTPVDPTIPAGSAIVVRKFTSDGLDKVLVNASNVTL
jgi:uncharacterized protein (TIGR02597 family)